MLITEISSLKMHEQHNDDFNATRDVPIGISFDESIMMVFNLFPYMCTILFIFYKVQVIVFNNIT